MKIEEFANKVEEIIKTTNTKMRLVFEKTVEYTYEHKTLIEFTKNFDKWDQIDMIFYQDELKTMIDKLSKGLNEKVRLAHFHIDNNKKKIFIELEAYVELDGAKERHDAEIKEQVERCTKKLNEELFGNG